MILFGNKMLNSFKNHMHVPFSLNIFFLTWFFCTAATEIAQRMRVFPLQTVVSCSVIRLLFCQITPISDQIARIRTEILAYSDARSVTRDRRALTQWKNRIVKDTVSFFPLGSSLARTV